MSLTDPPTPPSDPLATVIDGRLVVVVPTYNECDNIEELLGRISALPFADMSVIVVDDGSPDGTADEAERVAAQLRPDEPGFVHVLRRPGKSGLGMAYQAGLVEALSADPDFVAQMDADLSHRPEYLPDLVRRLVEDDAAVVIGSRYAQGGSIDDRWLLHRKLLSSWANFYVNAILRLKVRDATAGFKVWRAATLRDLPLGHLYSRGYSFQVEMNYLVSRQRARIVEQPIHFMERTRGQSKMRFSEKLESALMPFRLVARWRGR